LNELKGGKAQSQKIVLKRQIRKKKNWKKSEVKVFLKWGYEMDELKDNDLVTLYRNLKGRMENEYEIKQK
jgi:hypothetical protein